jgi:hypothetical protein
MVWDLLFDIVKSVPGRGSLAPGSEHRAGRLPVIFQHGRTNTVDESTSVASAAAIALPVPYAAALPVPLAHPPQPFLPTSNAVMRFGQYVDRGLLTFVTIQESSKHPGYYRIAVVAIPINSAQGGGYWNQYKKPVRADGIEYSVKHAIANPADWDRIVWEDHPGINTDAYFAPEDWTCEWKVQDEIAADRRAESQKYEKERCRLREKSEKQHGRKRGQRPGGQVKLSL